MTEYSKDAQRHGANVITTPAGIGGGLDQTDTELVNAWYYDRAAGAFVPWTDCTNAA